MSHGYRHIDHTGDVGIIVYADQLKKLFERAARAMFEVIADLQNVHPREKFHVDVSGSDLEALLVRWLSELNFRHVTEEKIFCRFKVIELNSTYLSADIWGEPIDPDKHKIYTEIKAITFHDLKIQQTRDGVEAQIIFDL